MTSITLSAPPQDLVSRVQFSPNSNKLLVASWDNTLRTYDSNSGALLTVSDMSAPLWDACWRPSGPDAIYTAGMERIIYEVNVESRRLSQMGQDHQGPIKSLVSNTSQLISGGLDRQLQYIDPRARPNESIFVKVPGKVFAMDLMADMLVVGLESRQIQVYDVRASINTPLVDRESTLRYSTRSIKCVPSNITGSQLAYVVSSIEGRAALEYVDGHEGFGFRCHRAKCQGEDVALPVNALAFNPKTNALFTGGSDCAMYSWDLNSRKKLKIRSSFPHSVMSLDIDGMGSKIAIGVSDDSYREDPQGLGRNMIESQIYIANL